MRRVLALCCLILLLLTMGGRSLFFELRLAEIRGQMRSAIAAGIQPATAKNFSFNALEAAQLVWLDGGEEFEWKGTRYDVLTRRKEQGRLVVQAISDEQETALVHSYRQHPDNRQPSSADILLKLASLNFLQPQGWELPIPFKSLPDRVALFDEQQLSTVYLESPEQPPRLAVAFF